MKKLNLYGRNGLVARIMKKNGYYWSFKKKLSEIEVLLLIDDIAQEIEMARLVRKKKGAIDQIKYEFKFISRIVFYKCYDEYKRISKIVKVDTYEHS